MYEQIFDLTKTDHFAANCLINSEKAFYTYRYMSLEQNDSKDRMIMVIIKKHKRNFLGDLPPNPQVS